MHLPGLFQDRNFRYYWFGVVFSQIGSRATTAAILWQVYQISGSTIATGLVGLSQGMALIVLAPLGGVIADRLDRARLLQTTQLVALLVDVYLIALTVSGHISPPLIYLGVVVTSMASSFDNPTRTALIGAMVAPEHLVEAFALTNPTRQVAVLLGPSIGGLLLAAFGPTGTYIFDAITYATLIYALALLKIPQLPPAPHRPSLLSSFGQGVGYVRQHPIIWQFITLDLSAMVFSAYTALLPALTQSWGIDAKGYGILFAMPSVGAIIGTFAYLHFSGGQTYGRFTLAATACYGMAVMTLGHASSYLAAIPIVLALGCLDAVAEIPRQVAVQAETPDEMRGRVTSLYQMASQGGPAIGNTLLGTLAASLGIPAALTIGGTVTIGYACFLAIRSKTVRAYQHQRGTA